jgi:hypothetical protein
MQTGKRRPSGRRFLLSTAIETPAIIAIVFMHKRAVLLYP